MLNYNKQEAQLPQRQRAMQV